jgi:predicted phosphodiesterase
VRYAVLSDIHGNRWALEAVLADVPAVDAVLNLGDILYGPLDPQGSYETLLELQRTRRVVTIRGNQDRDLYERRDGLPAPMAATIRYDRAALDPAALSWLASLPATLIVDGTLSLCHGTPESDLVYLLETFEPGRMRDPADIARRCAAVHEPVLLCGHTHTPRVVQVPGGPLVVNPGSVGLPAYQDETPVRHAMRTGSPHARYALLEEDAGQWRVDLRAIDYDWRSAAAAAKRNGRDDWSGQLTTGWAEIP